MRAAAACALARRSRRCSPSPPPPAPKPAAPASSKTPGSAGTRRSSARACGSGTSTSPRAARVPAILAPPTATDIGTVYIKAGDGATRWNQFNAPLVAALHRGGLKVCAWQFVYGDAPGGRGAGRRRRGPRRRRLPGDRRRGRVRRQIRRRRPLHPQPARRRSAPSFPLSLAGFPYVDYHPAFPYSVFLGPGGATVNQPQMYWKDIGTSVREVFAHTYLYNRLWGRPIFPIGQTYDAPGRGRCASSAATRRATATVPSWWDWQETTPPEWGALGAARRRAEAPRLRPRSRIPAAEDRRQRRPRRLGAGAPDHAPGDGSRSERHLRTRRPRRAVRAFQEAHGLPATASSAATPGRSWSTTPRSGSNGRRRRPIAERAAARRAAPRTARARRPSRRSATSSPPHASCSLCRLRPKEQLTEHALAGDLRRQPAEGRRADHQLVAVAEPDARFAGAADARPGCRWRRCPRARASSARRGRRPGAGRRR